MPFSVEMSGFFDDLACVVWKTNPFYWQAYAGLSAAKAAGAIKTKAECRALAKQGGDVASQYGIPGVISGTFGRCACEAVFSGGGAPPPPPPPPVKQRRYNVIWRRSSADQGAIYGWAVEHLDAATREAHGKGYRLITIVAYDIGGGQIRYDAVWNKSNVAQEVVWGWAPEHFAPKDADLRSKGYRLLALDTVDIGGGQFRHNAVWNKSGADQQAVYGWAPEHFLAKDQQMRAQGYQLALLDQFDLGGGQYRYNAAWNKGQLDQQAVYGWAPEHFAWKHDDLQRQGYRLVDVGTYDIGGGAFRMDGVWNKSGATQDAIWGWAPEHFLAKDQQMRDAGYRIIALDGFDI